MHIRMLLSLLCLVLAAASAAALPPSSALLSIDRMGAGIPAGWGTRGEGTTWDPATEAGPLGVGSARITLEDKGELSLFSPACAIPPDVQCRVSWWMRSEPAGAVVRVTLRDNYTEKVVAFDGDASTAGTEWKEFALSGPLQKMDRERYFLQVDIRGGGSTLFMDGLHFTTSPAAAATPRHASSVTLTPEEPWGIVTGEAPLRVKARVAGVTMPGCRLLARAVHVNGQVSELAPVPLDTAGIWNGVLTVAGAAAQPFGVLRVEATATGPDGAPLSAMGETLLARAHEPVPGPLPDSPFGIHVSLREPDLAAAEKLGYKWCRIHDASAITKWGAIEPEPDRWIWHDDEVALARGHGLSVLGMLDGSPAWESGNPEKTGYWSIYHAPNSLDLWRNYVRRVVEHYAGRIDQWEVWNEPWNMNEPGFFAGGSPWLYTALLESARTEAKTANPNSTVIGVNTWPPLWDQAVLAMGAYPYYDQMSFHSYDGTLHGRAADTIAQSVRRMEQAQAPYGPPKPLVATEGGPDVAGFHGSFFSFADPALSGDWSHGANQFARTYLSYIANGVKRFIAYSMHSEPRHYGEQTCMMVEPGRLPCPMHLTVSALARFVEGARFDIRLAPAPDVTALLFRQDEPRDYAPSGCTVAALFSDGEEPEDLPVTFPDGVRCFDRWGNPIPPPTRAEEGPVYVIAGEASRDALVDALRGAASDVQDSPEMLAKRTLAALTTGAPPIWTLFSAQGAVVLAGEAHAATALRRAQIKNGSTAAPSLSLPQDTVLTEQEWTPCGALMTGRLGFSGDGRLWSATVAALRDGPGETWRYLSFGLIPTPSADPAANREAEEALRAWETVMSTGKLAALRDNLCADAFCMVIESDVLGMAFWQNRDLLVSTLTGALTWGGASVSSMTGLHMATNGMAAACTGTWNLKAPFYNCAPMSFAATLLKRDGHWILASFCGAPPEQE